MLKRFGFCKLVLLFLCAVCVAQSEIDLTALDNQIAAKREKLAALAPAGVERENLLQEIAADLNSAGEIRFNRNEFETATNSFLEADKFLRQYHEIFYVRVKSELADTEQKLKNAEQSLQATDEIEKAADPKSELERRQTMVKIYRVVVSTDLSNATAGAQSVEDFDGQRAYLEQLGELARADGKLNQEAESLENIGALELDSGNSARAFEFYQKALELRRRDGKGDWRTIDRIADAHSYLGNYAQAAEKYAEIAGITKQLDAEAVESLTGKNEVQQLAILLERANLRMTIVTSLLDLAQVRALQGKYGESKQTIGEAQKILDEMGAWAAKYEGKEFGSILRVVTATLQAQSLRRQARIAEAEGDAPAAIKLYQDSLNYFSQLTGGYPSGAIAELRSRLAMLLAANGKFGEARANISDAMRIYARLNHEKAAVFALLNAARIELDAKQTAAATEKMRGAKIAADKLKFADLSAEIAETEADVLAAANPAASFALYKSAIEVYRKLEMRPALARALAAFAAALEKTGRTAEAENALREAVEIIETVRSGFGSATESENYSNRSDILDVYRRLIDLLAAQKRQSEALQFAVRAQRWELVSNLPTAEIKANAKSAAALTNLETAAGRRRAALANLENARSGDAQIVRVRSLTAAAKQAQQNYQTAIKIAETAQPALKLSIEPLDLTALQKSLGADEAAVLYLVTEKRLYLFVVRRDLIASKTVEINQAALENLIGEVRDSLTAFADDFYAPSVSAEEATKRETTRPDLRKPDGSEFSQKTLLPLKTSATELYQNLIAPIEDLLVGVKTLRIVPNDKLFLLPFAALVSPADNRYLLEKYNLVMQTAGDAGAAGKAVLNGDLIAFGNPTAANLDAALTEVEEIKKIFPRSQIFVDREATKERLFTIKSVGILHLATHGNVKTPLELSNIQLARLSGLEKPDLLYGEIYALPLESSEMIVMSACQTALGRAAGTKFGVFVEAFQTKTRSVAASLWSVDDTATKTLMVEFYKNLSAGKTRAASLRTAQLKVLHNPATKHPLFWAAFILYGDGDKLPTANQRKR